MENQYEFKAGLDEVINTCVNKGFCTTADMELPKAISR